MADRDTPLETMTLVVAPGPEADTFLFEGRVLRPPEGWARLPPGDAMATRRVKAAGPSWTVKARRGRRLISKGVWAPQSHIDDVLKEVEAYRESDAFERQRASAERAREAREALRGESLRDAVRRHLAFHPRHASFEARVVEATLRWEAARPQKKAPKVPATAAGWAREAERVVTAWMRHQTTGYDRLRLPRGHARAKRREARRKLEEQGQRLLNPYRLDQPVAPESCPLQRALAS